MLTIEAQVIAIDNKLSEVEGQLGLSADGNIVDRFNAFIHAAMTIVEKANQSRLPESAQDNADYIGEHLVQMVTQMNGNFHKTPAEQGSILDWFTYGREIIDDLQASVDQIQTMLC